MRDRPTQGPEHGETPFGHEVIFRASPIEQTSTLLPRTMNYVVGSWEEPETKERREYITTTLYRDRYNFPGTQSYLGFAVDTDMPLNVYDILHGESDLLRDLMAAPEPAPAKIYFVADTVFRYVKGGFETGVYSISPDGTVQKVVTDATVKPEREGEVVTLGKLDDTTGILNLQRGGEIELPIKEGYFNRSSSPLRVRKIWLQTPVVLKERGNREEAALPVPEETPIVFFNPPLTPDQVRRRASLM